MATEKSYEILKLVIMHENLGFIEPSFIKIEEILGWLEERAGEKLSNDKCRSTLAAAFTQYESMQLPVYDNKLCEGQRATLVLKEPFMSKCMIIVQDV